MEENHKQSLYVVIFVLCEWPRKLFWILSYKVACFMKKKIVGSVWGFHKFSSSFLGGVILYLFLRSVQLRNAWLLRKPRTLYSLQFTSCLVRNSLRSQEKKRVSFSITPKYRALVFLLIYYYYYYQSWACHFFEQHNLISSCIDILTIRLQDK